MYYLSLDITYGLHIINEKILVGSDGASKVSKTDAFASLNQLFIKILNVINSIHYTTLN